MPTFRPAVLRIALFKEGELVYFVPRHRIESRSAEDVAADLTAAFDRYFAPARRPPEMGTFHEDKHELHGITVVVDTVGDEIYIGRCDDMNEQGVLLLDVDVHKDGDDGRASRSTCSEPHSSASGRRFQRLVIPGRTCFGAPLGRSLIDR